MWRWTRRALGALCGLPVVAAVAGATYQWIATRNDLASYLVHRIRIACRHSRDLPGIAPLVPFLGAAGVARVFGVSFGQDPASLAPAVRGFARATRFRAAGFRAAAGELSHARESAAEVKATRRELTIPVVVVTGGRGADAAWRDLQRDQVGLSRHGCLVVAGNQVTSSRSISPRSSWMRSARP